MNSQIKTYRRSNLPQHVLSAIVALTDAKESRVSSRAFFTLTKEAEIDGRTIVLATVSLKHPRQSYIDRIGLGAFDGPIEVGYAGALPGFANDVVGLIKPVLPLLQALQNDRAIFATARVGNTAVENGLSELGFERYGSPYAGGENQDADYDCQVWLYRG